MSIKLQFRLLKTTVTEAILNGRRAHCSPTVCNKLHHAWRRLTAELISWAVVDDVSTLSSISARMWQTSFPQYIDFKFCVISISIGWTKAVVLRWQELQLNVC